MILAFLREAVFAGQIAVVGDMKAERLDDRLPLLYFIYKIFIYIPGKQAALFRKSGHCLQDLRQFLPGICLSQPLSQESSRLL